MNQCFVQITGPFIANQEIVSILKVQYSFSKIVKLGIQAKTGHKCKINSQEIEIGKTGIYELNDVEVDSIVFMQNENESTIIDCVVE